MRYFADTADLFELEDLLDWFPLAGITTNPTLLKKSGMKLSSVLSKLSALAANRMLHVQLISDEADEMVREARTYRSLLENDALLYVKIPVTPDGYKAMRRLKEEQFRVTATAIFTQQQALVAARAGADFVAPYVNRLEQYNSRGIQLIGDIATSLKEYNLDTQILAASFKTAEQVQQACLAGAHAVTLNYDLLGAIVEHPLTDQAVDQFREDGQSMYDIPLE